MDHSLAEMLRDVPRHELLLLAARSNPRMRERITRAMRLNSRTDRTAQPVSSRSSVPVSSPSRS
ncbi:MAG: hypothetical protein GC200_07615 [Tepidisphaera sp.]|nr:hypothetical protein [Tepidisphaera sp.]